MTYFFFAKDEIEIGDKPRQIYDKDKYIYHERLNTGEVIKNPTFVQLQRALSAGRYSSVQEENGQRVEEFYAETRLRSKFYISDFVKGHFGSSSSSFSSGGRATAFSMRRSFAFLMRMSLTMLSRGTASLIWSRVMR